MISALPALVPVIGWALLHFIWQGLLIGWGVTLAMHLLRGARPQTRYAVCCAAMLLCAALPLSGVLMHLADAGDGMEAASAGQGAAALSIITAAAQGSAIGPLLDDGTLTSMEVVLRRQLPWIVSLWLAGAALMSLRLAIGLKWVAEHTRPDQYTVNHYWQRRLSELARRFDIDTHVRLGVADRLDSPITAGCWRPIVLVPAALVTGMPAELLEALLAHELAHIKRHDYLVNLIQSAIEIVLFYHPSVWALSRRIRIEREQIADDLAVAKLGQPQKLAQALSELDRFQFATTQLAHAAHGGNLMSRIKRLLRPDVEPVSWKMAMPLLGLCAASAVFYAHAAPQPPAVPEPPQAPAIIAPIAPVEPVASVAPAVPAAKAAKAAPMRMIAAPAAPAAPMAAVAMPAMPPVRATPAVPRLERESTAYAVVRGEDDRMLVSANRKDLAKVKSLRNTVKGDFIWFREGDQAYLIQDPSLIVKVNQAWEPSNRIGAQMDEQGAKMDQHGKVMDALGAQLDVQVSEAMRDTERDIERKQREMERVARQQEAVGRRMERIAREMEGNPSQEKIRQFHEKQEQLRVEMGPLSKQMAQFQRDVAVQTAKIQAAQGPIHELGRKMAEAGKPMAELGVRMGELGRQQAKASREAERATKALIKEAVKNGKATPVPSAG